MSTYSNRVDDYKLARLYTGEDLSGVCIVVNTEDLYVNLKSFIQYYIPELYYDFYADLDPLRINRPSFNGIYLPKDLILNHHDQANQVLGWFFSNSSLTYEAEVSEFIASLYIKCFFGLEFTVNNGSEVITCIYCPKGTTSFSFEGVNYITEDAQSANLIAYLDSTILGSAIGTSNFAESLFNMKGYSLNKGDLADEHTYVCNSDFSNLNTLLQKYLAKGKILRLPNLKLTLIDKGLVDTEVNTLYLRGTEVTHDNKKYLCLKDTNTYCTSPYWILI